MTILAVVVGAAAAATPAPRVLRVCSDPNNMPFSNERQEGFENRIAALLAKELGARVEYVWWAQRRGYIRNTIKAGLCDVYIGVPAAMEMLSTTAPYYRSTYVFVYRKGAARIDSLDSPALRKLRVGVQLVGDDYANTPPAHALARRGIISNVRGYSVIGDYSKPNPPSRIIEAVASGEIDVAIGWGPMAGYFARRQSVPLEVTPVQPQIEGALPFVYDISMGVRRGDAALKADIERALDKRRAEIRRILDQYGVPQLPVRKASIKGDSSRCLPSCKTRTRAVVAAAAPPSGAGFHPAADFQSASLVHPFMSSISYQKRTAPSRSRLKNRARASKRSWMLSHKPSGEPGQHFSATHQVDCKPAAGVHPAPHGHPWEAM